MPEGPTEIARLQCDLLVFDLDGTLINSQQDLANSVNATLAFLHRPRLENEQIATFIGDGATVLMQRALHATGGADEALLASAMPFFLAYYREHIQNYGGNSFETKKPHPLGMHTLMQEASAMLGREVQARRTVLIGDSHVDVETARSAGTLCLGCSYGLDPERLRAARPDCIVDKPEHWLNALCAMLGSISLLQP